MFRLKKVIKNIKGSEVVEKMLMVIVSVTLVAVAIGFMNKYINGAIEKQGGIINGSGGNSQIVMPNPDLNDNGNNNDIDSKILGNWKLKPNVDYSKFKDINYKFKATLKVDKNIYWQGKKMTLGFENMFSDREGLGTNISFFDKNNFSTIMSEPTILSTSESNICIEIIDISNVQDKQQFYDWLKLVADKEEKDRKIRVNKLEKNNIPIFESPKYKRYEHRDYAVINDVIYYLTDYTFNRPTRDLFKYDVNTDTNTLLYSNISGNLTAVGERLFIWGLAKENIDDTKYEIYEFDLFKLEKKYYATIDLTDIFQFTKEICFNVASDDTMYFFNNRGQICSFNIITKTINKFLEPKNETPGVLNFNYTNDAYYANNCIYKIGNDGNYQTIRYNIEKNSYDLLYYSLTFSVINPDASFINFFSFEKNNLIYSICNSGYIFSYDPITKAKTENYEFENFEPYVYVGADKEQLNHFKVIKLKSKLLIETMDTNMNPVYYEIPLSEFVV